jgi:hypothetical protein
LADRQDFRVRRRIGELARAIAGTAEHAAIACDDDGTDGHLAAR